jgi:hypothetical protein
MTKFTCAFAGIEFRMSGCLKAAHKPLGRQMAGEYIVGPFFNNGLTFSFTKEKTQ